MHLLVYEKTVNEKGEKAVKSNLMKLSTMAMAEGKDSVATIPIT